MKNLCSKTRDIENPYLIYKNDAAGWEWRVLKIWQADDNEPYARWFVAAKSPMTYGSWEMGDSYVSEVKENGICVYKDPVVFKD